MCDACVWCVCVQCVVCVDLRPAAGSYVASPHGGRFEGIECGIVWFFFPVWEHCLIYLDPEVPKSQVASEMRFPWGPVG